MTFGRIDSTPFTLSDFYEPLKLIFRPVVFLPAFALSAANMLGSIIINVDIPQLFAEKFDFNAQQLGYQFSGMIIGKLIGEQISGRLSDAWMSQAERRQGRKPAPEFRLWLLHIGLWSTIAGVVVFFVRIEQALPLHYNVTPVVGSAISVAGVQIITTTAVTYAVDCYRHEAGSIGVVVNTIRQTVGFTGPFWYVISSTYFVSVLTPRIQVRGYVQQCWALWKCGNRCRLTALVLRCSSFYRTSIRQEDATCVQGCF